MFICQVVRITTTIGIVSFELKCDNTVLIIRNLKHRISGDSSHVPNPRAMFENKLAALSRFKKSGDFILNTLVNMGLLKDTSQCKRFGLACKSIEISAVMCFKSLLMD